MISNMIKLEREKISINEIKIEFVISHYSNNECKRHFLSFIFCAYDINENEDNNESSAPIK